VESFPSESFEGVVKRIAPMGQELNNVTTFEVRVTISNPHGKLRANMTANAEIVLEERKAVLLIPEGALVYGRIKGRRCSGSFDAWIKGSRKRRSRSAISNGSERDPRGLAEGDKLVLP